MIRLLIISLILFSCKGNAIQEAKSEATRYSAQIEQIKSDTLLVGIQRKIDNAFGQSMATKDGKTLLELKNSLAELKESNQQNIIIYWQAYLQYYLAIYHLNKGNDKKAEEEVEKGINWLSAMKSKNSEDYALLAMLQSFSIQFNPMRAMLISADLQSSIEKAMAIDSTNLRAHYVKASNDFYTPEEYGGGQVAEKYLLKAIELPSQKVKNEYLPSWGKEESYEMLIKLYIKKENWDLAKKYYREGVQEFPESYMINQLASKLVDK